jgi:hypothetical protein
VRNFDQIFLMVPVELPLSYPDHYSQTKKFAILTQLGPLLRTLVFSLVLRGPPFNLLRQLPLNTFFFQKVGPNLDSNISNFFTFQKIFPYSTHNLQVTLLRHI